MTRSLFFSFFVRLSVAMALVVAMRVWLVPRGWILPTLFVLGFASLNAWLLVRSIQASLRPLQSVAGNLAVPNSPSHTTEGRLAHNLQRGSLDSHFSDFDGLALALVRAGREVDAALLTASSSHDELVAMIDSLQDAVVAVDPAGRLQWVNQHFQRLLPSVASPGAVRIGQALVHLIRDPDVLECVRVALEQRSFCQKRTTLLLPGRIVEVNASPMPSGGAVALLHDITRIEQVERTQREFVANVSHELRTPLTSITGYVETLLDHERALTPQARTFLETILKNATRMNRLTEDLLTMARVESPGNELQPVPIALESLVRDAIQGVSGVIQTVEATVEVADLPSAAVLADRDAAIQVLTNLVENAIKYGRNSVSGHARVVVSARTVQEPIAAVEFSVRDFGPGIASEHLSRLFERFYRVDKARSLETGGTGLGLAIARHIVQSLGGQIRAESELNKGSNFLFTLPLAAESDPQVALH